MNNSENIDLLRFKLKNFGQSNEKKWAKGQIMIKHNVFDWFGGDMPWSCSADAELIFRIRLFVYEGTVEKIVFRRRVYTSNLTVKGKTKMFLEKCSLIMLKTYLDLLLIYINQLFLLLSINTMKFILIFALK